MSSNPTSPTNLADVAQSVAHILGKDEVAGSIPAISTSTKGVYNGK